MKKIINALACHYETLTMNTRTLALAVACAVCGTEVQAIGDSLAYLSPADTVFIEIAPDQTKYTTHTFAPRQTVYSLSRFYAQDIDQLYRLNPELRQGEPTIGQQVRIAVPNVAIRRYRGEDFDKSAYSPLCYRIRPGETMYGIAKTIFRMPVDTLMAVNGLASHALTPGQVVQVGWIPVAGAGDLVRKRPLDPLQKVNYANYLKYEKQATPRSERRGVASWTEGTGEASGRLYALSSEYPAGSIVKLTNPANRQFAYVEIIGKLASNVRKASVDIRVSGTAARLLGAESGNFYVVME